MEQSTQTISQESLLIAKNDPKFQESKFGQIINNQTWPPRKITIIGIASEDNPIDIPINHTKQ